MYELRQWLKEKRHKTSPWGEKLDSNGYAESIWDTEDGRCLLCKKHCDTARHEVFFGTADRKTSKAAGCWLYVCPDCHNRIHSDADYDMALKMSTQALFERVHHHAFDAGVDPAHEEFTTLFGKNYL